MENLEIIELIMQKVTVKYIQRDCKKLLKHISKKSSKDIGIVAELTTLLYAFGMYEEALKVCDLIEDMVFTGNYTIWDNVVNARLIAVRIHRELGNPEKSNELMRSISSTFKPSLYMNQKKCLDLYDDNIRFAKERNDKPNPNSWLLLKYEFMIRFYETPDFPIDKNNLNEEIEKTTQEIRKLLS